MTATLGREVWGAAPPARAYTSRDRNARCVVHHTAGDYIAPEEGRPGPRWWALVESGRASVQVRRAIRAHQRDRANVEAREHAAMRAMQAAHRARGYIDIGYHAVVFPSGRVYAGRPLDAVGAHAVGGNQMLGFSFAGNFERDKPTPRALAAFANWCDQVGVTATIGHYRVPGNATACPGRHMKIALGL